MTVFATANILQAFEPTCVGSRVVDRNSFTDRLTQAVKAFDFEGQDTPGQGFVPLPLALPFVTAGVGRHVDDPSAYVLRSWRGSVNAYLRREHAAPVESLAVIVYTADAYLADPDVASDPSEVARINCFPRASHVIVAVLASAGPRAPLSPGRLVSNLAGGNKDALTWDADTIRSKASESAAYSNEWGVVAD